MKLTDAAKHYKELPHQIAALNFLQSTITPETMREFQEMYRAAPQPKPSTYENTWAGVAAAARVAGAKFPELVAAQWALESDWGKATSGKHNYFGLKGPGTKRKTEEVINGKRVTIEAEFLDFRDLGNCVQYLVDRWYRDWKEHKGINRAATREEAANLLVAEGYATDPDYAAKLVRLMDQHAPRATSSGILAVPYFSQRDSKAPGQAARMCFSSSCAMLVAFMRPGAIADDDAFLSIVRQFGDTTDANAQIKALASVGIKARFTQTAAWEDLIRQVERGIPVPCGFLHHGPVSAPSGGGHWLTVIGAGNDAVTVNDPWGEMDLVGGAYPSTNGARKRYSRKNWGPRWLVEGPRSGWAIIAEP